MKRFVVGKEQFPMFFEPAVGEVFEYVHDGTTTLLQVEEKKNGFCGEYRITVQLFLHEL